LIREIPQKLHLRKWVLTADLREQNADDSENAAISSDSEQAFVRDVVNVVSAGLVISCQSTANQPRRMRLCFMAAVAIEKRRR